MPSKLREFPQFLAVMDLKVQSTQKYPVNADVKGGLIQHRWSSDLSWFGVKKEIDLPECQSYHRCRSSSLGSDHRSMPKKVPNWSRKTYPEKPKNLLTRLTTNTKFGLEYIIKDYPMVTFSFSIMVSYYRTSRETRLNILRVQIYLDLVQRRRSTRQSHRQSYHRCKSGSLGSNHWSVPKKVWNWSIQSPNLMLVRRKLKQKGLSGIAWVPRIWLASLMLLLHLRWITLL